VAPSRSSDNSEPCDFFECNPHYELKCTASQVHHFTLPQRARAFLFRKGVWAEKNPVYDPRIRFADLLFQARTVTAHGREGSCHHRLQVSASPPRRGEALERELAIPARALARALARTLARTLAPVLSVGVAETVVSCVGPRSVVRPAGSAACRVVRLRTRLSGLPPPMSE
jgi:hypothetical protein